MIGVSMWDTAWCWRDCLISMASHYVTRFHQWDWLGLEIRDADKTHHGIWLKLNRLMDLHFWVILKRQNQSDAVTEVSGWCWKALWTSSFFSPFFFFLGEECWWLGPCSIVRVWIPVELASVWCRRRLSRDLTRAVGGNHVSSDEKRLSLCFDSVPGGKCTYFATFYPECTMSLGSFFFNELT